jgi:glutathione S-transferase
MITLYSAGPAFGLPEASPYVTKTEIQLRMAGLDYLKEPASPDTSPKGQLPWIDDEGLKVADSTFIRAHLERKYGLDFDEALTPVQRAQAWAIERMLENHFGWTSGYARWLLPENFEKGPGRWFDAMPPEQANAVRADVLGRVRETMRCMGVARHSESEIVELGDQSLAALSLLLGDKPFMMGDAPCGMDATAVAMLAGILTPYFDSPLRRRAEAYANLVAYSDRLMAQFYPEFPWKRDDLAAAA